MSLASLGYIGPVTSILLALSSSLVLLKQVAVSGGLTGKDLRLSSSPIASQELDPHP